MIDFTWMLDIQTLIVLAFAVWRLSHVLVSEDGIFEIFIRLRVYIGIVYQIPQSNGYMIFDKANLSDLIELSYTDDIEGEATRYGSNTFARMLNCIWCTSFWVSVLYVGLMSIAPIQQWVYASALIFALSACAIVIDKKS